jgi:hypothetical protein
MAVAAAAMATEATAKLTMTARARRLDFASTTRCESGVHKVALNGALHDPRSEEAFTDIPKSKSAEIKNDIHANGMGLMLS